MLGTFLEERIAHAHAAAKTHWLFRVEPSGSEAAHLPVVLVCNAREGIERRPNDVVQVDIDSSSGHVEELNLEVIAPQG